MLAVLNATLPVFALVLLGYGCARRGVLGPSVTDALNDFVVWLALPALLFQAMAAITAEQIDHPGFLLAFGGGTAITFVLSFLLDRRRGHLADRSIEGLDAAYSNTGFMGIPLCLAVFGPAGLPAAVISTLFTACALFAVSVVLIELGLQADPQWGRARLGHILGKVARSVGRNPLVLGRNPLVLAPLLGLACAAAGLRLPEAVLRFTTLLGAAASPCALVTIGLFLAERHGGGDLRAVGRLVGLKLLVQPMVTALLVRLLPMPPVWADAALLLSALPIGTGPFMLAKLYGREAAVTSRAILLSTLLSVLTVSALVAWFGLRRG